MRAFLVVSLSSLLMACGTPVGYPDLADTPERPEPTLTQDRAEELAEELQSAREEAISRSREGLEEEIEEDQE